MRPLQRLLIANRGEIAIRIARTARAMGIGTVGVVSDADAGAPHARAVDLALPIGGDRAADSYLRGDRIVAAAVGAGSDAVHPGYGFLAENAAFAEAVLAAGLAWIGPPPAAMRAMADKAAARRHAHAHGVPVVPGCDGADASAATLRREAERIGWPLLVKAAAGGGGRGMRVVRDASQLDDALAAAAREAEAAFGDGRLVLERYLEGARHVEVQLFADAHGHVIHLGERDCSVQRRHQKLIEEAPAPGVSPALRRAIGEAAVTLARSVGYVGAGTAEFLLATDGAFHFIEMNTRLQVEHAVTEALVGADLVEWQIRVARGEALPSTQDEALARFEHGGHAIEARLCAEDPVQGDLPQTGTVWRWRAPPGVRVDHALGDGVVVGPFYDAMVAKLVAHAPERKQACDALAAALDATVCLGLVTNRALLAHVLRDEAFRAGRLSTSLLAERVADRAVLAQATGDARSARLAALARHSMTRLPRTALPTAWQGWSLPLGTDGETTTIAAWAALPDEPARPSHDGRITGRVTAVVDGTPLVADYAADGDHWWWQAGPVLLALADDRLQPRRRHDPAAEGRVVAPLHGRVTRVEVTPGAAVEADALLVVVEAMKMEHQLRAPCAGVVRALHVQVGDQVATRQALAEIG